MNTTESKIHAYKCAKLRLKINPKVLKQTVKRKSITNRKLHKERMSDTATKKCILRATIVSGDTIKVEWKSFTYPIKINKLLT